MFDIILNFKEYYIVWRPSGFVILLVHYNFLDAILNYLGKKEKIK